MRLPSLALILSLLLFSPALALAAETETYRDELLSHHRGFENVSLAQIYLALPQQLFECDFQSRVSALVRGHVEFNHEKKEIHYGGDGGQMSLTIRVTTQTKDSLILHVTGESEGKIFYRLERIPNGWKAKVTFPEEK
ncbi:hypothetical protein [Prosthecobacter sp.]|uniref:hypothetical protein n=1 Tax=Prosthecobacter sp. TaxID=1965333 RepID=UPI00378307E9